MTAAICDCADCRQYRLWRAEGTDEWQPKREGPDGWSAATEPAVADADAVELDVPEEPAPSF